MSAVAESVGIPLSAQSLMVLQHGLLGYRVLHLEQLPSLEGMCSHQLPLLLGEPGWLVQHLQRHHDLAHIMQQRTQADGLAEVVEPVRAGQQNRQGAGIHGMGKGVIVRGPQSRQAQQGLWVAVQTGHHLAHHAPHAGEVYRLTGLRFREHLVNLVHGRGPQAPRRTESHAHTRFRQAPAPHVRPEQDPVRPFWASGSFLRG